VPRRVNVDDLLDARGVADLLGLSHPNTVSVYQRRYDDMPKPAVDLGKGRVKLWLKPELETWARERPRDRGRPRGGR
jgi:predicted DNA-binding transcriptional regulator AlpA